MTAMREGTEGTNGYWTIFAKGAPMFGVPTVTLIFTVVGQFEISVFL
jgi:hypothetical protein